MKFDVLFPNAKPDEEPIPGFFKSDTTGPCFICGQPTSWCELEFQDRCCSQECYDKMVRDFLKPETGLKMQFHYIMSEIQYHYWQIGDSIIVAWRVFASDYFGDYVLRHRCETCVNWCRDPKYFDAETLTYGNWGLCHLDKIICRKNGLCPVWGISCLEDDRAPDEDGCERVFTTALGKKIWQKSKGGIWQFWKPIGCEASNRCDFSEDKGRSIDYIIMDNPYKEEN